MRASKSFAIVLVLALSLLPALSACAPQSVDVTLDTYTITLSRHDVVAGKINFHVTNAATDQPHELVVLKTNDPDPYLVLGPEGDADEGAPGVTLMGETGPMAIGAVQDLTLDLPHGQYVLICNLTENALHYQQGQHTFFNVK